MGIGLRCGHMGIISAQREAIQGFSAFHSHPSWNDWLTNAGKGPAVVSGPTVSHLSIHWPCQLWGPRQDSQVKSATLMQWAQQSIWLTIFCWAQIQYKWKQWNSLANLYFLVSWNFHYISLYINYASISFFFEKISESNHLNKINYAAKAN